MLNDKYEAEIFKTQSQTILLIKSLTNNKFYCPLLLESKRSSEKYSFKLLTAILDEVNRGTLHQIKITTDLKSVTSFDIQSLISEQEFKAAYNLGVTPMTSFVHPANGKKYLIAALWSNKNTNLRYTINSGAIELENKHMLVRNIEFDEPHDCGLMFRSISKVLVIDKKVHVWFASSFQSNTFLNPTGEVVDSYDYYKGELIHLANDVFQVTNIRVCHGVKEQFTNSVGVGRSEIIFDEIYNRFVGFFSIRSPKGYHPITTLISADGVHWDSYASQTVPKQIRKLVFASKCDTFWTGNTNISGSSNLEILACDR